MVVQHNMQASNASRMLNITAGNQSKSTEKLASGYKINRAADDAAGLSISENMGACCMNLYGHCVTADCKYWHGVAS